MLRDFTKPAAPPARAIVEQAPAARQLLVERCRRLATRIRAEVRACGFPTAIFISTTSATLDDALKLAMRQLAEAMYLVHVVDLESLRTGRDGLERVLTQLKGTG